jgi:hypothetical protein
MSRCGSRAEAKPCSNRKIFLVADLHAKEARCSRWVNLGYTILAPAGSGVGGRRFGLDARLRNAVMPLMKHPVGSGKFPEAVDKHQSRRLCRHSLTFIPARSLRKSIGDSPASGLQFAARNNATKLHRSCSACPSDRLTIQPLNNCVGTPRSHVAQRHVEE